MALVVSLRAVRQHIGGCIPAIETAAGADVAARIGFLVERVVPGGDANVLTWTPVEAAHNPEIGLIVLRRIREQIRFVRVSDSQAAATAPA